MGKVFVCGDTHGTHDIRKCHKWYNTDEYQNLTKEDVVIQLGDWGGVWYYPGTTGYTKDNGNQIKWARKNFTLAVVLGNHENYDVINKLPIEEKWGGKVRVLTPRNPYNKKTYGSIYILMRGEIYTINGKKFLAAGGAMSQDKAMRVEGQDWWRDELWFKEEEDNCLDNLDKHNWEVDYVVAHTCTHDLAAYILSGMRPAISNDRYWSAKGKVNDPTCDFFQHLVNEGLKFKDWHFGHWHIDESWQTDHGWFHCHYNGPPHEIKD